MSPGEVLLLGAAGGIGAAVRYAVDTAVSRRLRSALPVATIGINVTGSFALGLVAGLALAGALGAGPAAVLGTGFLGGYTTFSTASYQSVSLALAGKWGAAVVNALGTLVLALAAALAGLLLAGPLLGA
ncbi:CrcB family protein [Sinomonas halotolerans]|uniref:Fluoride-specific ion channel FluC n=1 Tax=Sinomonas halotolerans TaxID=1644133 RepID=A0ABU9X2B7_9MICC